MNTHKKSILFSIEFTSRELVSKCLLALKLAQRGFRVYIGTFSSINQLAQNKCLVSCIYFHKSTHESKVLEYKEKLGSINVFMDEEAGVAIPRSKLHEFCSLRYSTVNQNKYSAIFTIGEKYKQEIQKMPNTAGVKIIASGWPRIDMWKSKYKKFYQEEVEEIINKHGSFYLIITSFGVTSKETYKRRMASDTKSFRVAIREHKYQIFKEYIRLIQEISQKLSPDEKIIIRPHPSEQISDWKKITSEFKNVIVVKKGDITPWILAASSILQHGSTASIQAAMNFKPTIQYKISPITGITDTPVLELSENCNSADEVLEKLRNNKTICSEKIRDQAIDSIKEDVSNLGNVDAADVIAEELDLFEVSKQPKVTFLFWTKIIFFLEYRISRLKSCISKKLKIKNSHLKPTKFEKIPNGITIKEISSIVEKLASLNNIRTERLQFNTIITDLVSIEMKE